MYIYIYIGRERERERESSGLGDHVTPFRFHCYIALCLLDGVKQYARLNDGNEGPKDHINTRISHSG